MKESHKKINLLFCVVLLLIVIILPFVFLKTQDYLLINTIYKENYTSQNLKNTETKMQLSHLQKIQMLQESFINKNENIIVTSYQTNFNKQKQLPLLTAELKKLISYKLIPDIDMTNHFSCYMFVKSTYTDISRGQYQMNIWNINCIVDQKDISIVMDADTYYIYEVNIIYKDKEYSQEFEGNKKTDTLLSVYLDHYLKIDDKQGKKYIKVVDKKYEYYHILRIYIND